MKGWKGARDKASVSNLARKRLAYEGAILVPIPLPCVCKQCLSLKEKLFIMRIMRMRSQSVSVLMDKALRSRVLGSFSNDDGDGIEDVKKPIGLY